MISSEKNAKNVVSISKSQISYTQYEIQIMSDGEFNELTGWKDIYRYFVDNLFYKRST
jgi:hypothetical protein